LDKNSRKCFDIITFDYNIFLIILSGVGGDWWMKDYNECNLTNGSLPLGQN